MTRIIEVSHRGKYTLWIRFSDGVVGECDLAEFVGKGVFAALSDVKQFAQVRIGDSGELKWGEQVDLCPDALYLRITGKRPEDLFPLLKNEVVGA